jgi:L-threonylcarbamoyladenylate synthase
VQAELGSALRVLDGGPCPVGIESTLVDCTRGAPVVLRPGQITREQLQAACGRSVELPAKMDSAAPRASGTLESHYAPQARVRLMQGDELAQRVQALGSLANNLALWSREQPPQLGAGVIWREQPQHAEDAARELFATLREFDLHGVQQIWVELPPETPDWEGVRDRLKRAAA